MKKENTNQEVNLAELTRHLVELSKELANIRTHVTVAQKPSYTNKELMELFDVSSSTLKKWRTEGYIGYSQVNNVYLYSISDIEDFLSRTHSDAFFGFTGKKVH